MGVWTSLSGSLALVVCLYRVAAESTTGDVLKCMSCTEASNVADCKDIVKCDRHTDVCYVQKETNTDGEAVVHAGCRKKTVCERVGCFDEVSQNRNPDLFEDKNVTCHDCCDGDLCNMYGCPEKYDANSNTGIQCFACTHVMEIDKCNTIHSCNIDQVCFQEQVIHSNTQKYNLGCKSKRMCDILNMLKNNAVESYRKKREVKLADDCCEYDFCNRFSPVASATPSNHSAKYKCPRPNDVINYKPTDSSTASSTTVTTATTTSTTTTELSTTTTTAQVVNTCEDRNLNCADYGHEFICNGKYIPWAMEQCQKYCGFCETASKDYSRIRCYVCKHAMDPSFCHTTDTCYEGEVCFQETVYYAGATKYNMACKSKRMCDLLHMLMDKNEVNNKRKKREVKLSTECCEHDFCNGIKLMHTAPTTTTTTTTLSTTTTQDTTEICRDKYTSCFDYDQSSCTDPERMDYMYNNCQRYCNMCAEPLPCTDVLVNCSDYGADVCASQLKDSCQLYCLACNK